MIEVLDLAPKTPPRNLRLLQGLVGFFLLAKLIFLFGAGPASDEAYYWLWGQHPALSYYDHPPLHAWLSGIMRLLLGHNLFALRALTLLTLGGTLYIFSIWARRYAGPHWRTYFWSGAVIYLASALFGLFFSVVFQDYLFAFLGLASAHFFLTYLGDFSGTGRGRLRDLYLGALFLGLTALTKYSAILFGLALVGTIVFSRDLRPLLRNLHLYLAGLLSIVMQAPVLIWNWQNGFVSFGFQLSGRHGTDWWMRPTLDRIFEFPLASILLVGPFLVPVFVRFFLARPATAFESVARRYALWAFWLTNLVIIAMSLFNYVNVWWCVPAYIVAMGFAARYAGRLLLYAHAAFGVILALGFVISFVFIPIPTLLGRYDFRMSEGFGWGELAAPIQAAQAQHGAGFIASDMPKVASIAAFALNDPTVTSLTHQLNQFDYWFDPQAHAGEDAIVVLDQFDDPAEIASRFQSFEPIQDVEVRRFGYWIRGFKLFLGRGFIPPAAP